MGKFIRRVSQSDAPSLIEPLEPRRLLAATVFKQFAPPDLEGEYHSAPSRVETVGSLNLLFTDDGNFGRQMWRTDGTSGGTVPLTDQGYALNPVAYRGRVYFFAAGGLWRTDGTRGGTEHVFGERGKPFKTALGLTVVGEYLLFTDNSSQSWPYVGARLWRSDGTAQGTVLVHQAVPATSGDTTSHAGVLTPVADGRSAVFVMNNAEQGRELWRTDGTAEGTYLVKDLDPFGSSEANIFTRVGDEVFFFARSRSSKEDPASTGLWKTDGTTEGTVLIRSSIRAAFMEPAVIGSTMYFTSDASGGGFELWKSDGTNAGTRLVRDVFPGTFDHRRPFPFLTSSSTLVIDTGGDPPTTGPNSGSPSNLTVAGGLLYFTASSRHGRELWCSDGTEAGTQRLTDLMPGSGGSYFSSFTAVGDTLFFAVGPFPPTEGAPDWSGAIFKSDGTPEGTVQIIDGLVSPGMLSSVDGSLFFHDHGDGWRMWRFDETGVIAGYVFNDVDGDGMRDAHELGQVGWRVFIDKDGDGVRDRGEPSAFTSASGRYRLDLLPRGTFNLRVSPADADWSATAATIRPTFAAAGRTSFADLGWVDRTPLLGTVRGTVFDDANLDGAMDAGAGDTPVQGARVFLDIDSDGGWDADEPAGETSLRGEYRIDHVPLGRYAVRMAPPAGMPGFHFTLGGGERVLVDTKATVSSHFGVYFDPRDSVIHGTVFHDRDTNGVHDRGEAAFSGMRVYLDANRNRRMDADERSALTDSTGYFKFTRLKRGTYFVRQVATPDGEWAPSGAPVFVTSMPRSSSRTAPFSYVRHGTASVSGLTFKDVNGDGEWDVSEGGESGWNVYVDLNRDGERDAGEPHAISNMLGSYMLHSLLSGTYLVRFVPAKTNATMSHGAAAVEVTLRPGQQRRVNAGAWQPAVVTGAVLHDRDADGVVWAEEGIGGITVYLDVNRNGQHDPGIDPTTVTRSGGHYRFEGVRPGLYYTIAVPPAGWGLTTPTYARSIVAGPTIYYPSMGLANGIDVQGHMFADNDGNGVFSMGDRTLLGYTIYIDDDNDGALDDGETRAEYRGSKFFILPKVAPGKRVLRFIHTANARTLVEPRRFVITVSRAGVQPGDGLIFVLPVAAAT